MITGIVAILGGWRAAAFLALALGVGLWLGVTKLQLIHARADLLQMQGERDAAKGEVARITGEMDKCVAANGQVVSELKRVTEESVAAEKRAIEARLRAERSLALSDARLKQLERELVNAPPIGVAAPDSLVDLFDGLRQSTPAP